MGRAVVFAAFMSAVFVAFLILWPNSRPDGQQIIQSNFEPRYEAPARARNVTPDETLPGPVFEDGVLERLPGKKSSPPPKKKPKPVKISRVQVIEPGILKSGKRTVRLAEIEPIPLDQKCEAVDGSLWPCGRFARTEMRQFIRNRPIECDPAADEDQDVTLRCRLDNFDISGWLVLTGWATPSGNQFESELSEAKAKQRGQWRKSAP